MKMAKFYVASLFCVATLFASDTSSEMNEEFAMLDPTPFAPQTFTQEDVVLAPKLAHKNSFITVGLAFLSPGLGHLYLGDYKTAAGLGGSAWTLAGLNSADFNSGEFHPSNFVALQNTWFYNVYAAYRDVRLYNQQEGYQYKMPTDSLLDLTLAPFKWSVIKQPGVWGGVLTALTLGATMSYLLYDPPPAQIASENRGVLPLLAFPIGIGEESFFRGFLQPCLAEMTSPLGGIILSSLAFGAMHIPNAEMMEPESRWKYYAGSLPLITAFGAYFGYLAYKSGSLQQSVATHAWYDFTLFLLSYSVAQSAAIGTPSFAFSFSF